jgi:hypothetical protein
MVLFNKQNKGDKMKKFSLVMGFWMITTTAGYTAEINPRRPIPETKEFLVSGAPSGAAYW